MSNSTTLYQYNKTIDQEIIKPLIKWTGGKFKEFKKFNDLIPAFNRYFEPFFGGGGVFFALGCKPKSYVNDKSSDLISFYSLLANENFKKELNNYIDVWGNLDILVKEIAKISLPLFQKLKKEIISKEVLKEKVAIIADEIKKSSNPYLLDTSFIVDEKNLRKEIRTNLYGKYTRIKKIEEREGRNFSDDEMFVHTETAIRSSFYMHCRFLLNQNKTQSNSNLTEEKRIANWFIVRELCYASMFRFNKNGDFNIPYGGIAYNTKNIKLKVDNIFSKKVTNLFKNTKIFNSDFEDFFNQFSFKDTDFIFLDPPYDSEFSEYDQNSFTKSDQQRLANILYTCNAKWMLVIKNTNFIFDLYNNKDGINISTFDKTYLYNVRGRNNRDTEHLIISNYVKE